MPEAAEFRCSFVQPVRAWRSRRETLGWRTVTPGNIYGC